MFRGADPVPLSEIGLLPYVAVDFDACGVAADDGALACACDPVRRRARDDVESCPA